MAGNQRWLVSWAGVLRRRLRFSLRTMFVALTLASLILGFVLEHRQRMAAELAIRRIEKKIARSKRGGRNNEPSGVLGMIDTILIEYRHPVTEEVEYNLNEHRR